MQETSIQENNQEPLQNSILNSENSESFSRDTSQSVQSVASNAQPIRSVNRARQKRRLIERWVKAQEHDSPIRIETSQRPKNR